MKKTAFIFLLSTFITPSTHAQMPSDTEPYQFTVIEGQLLEQWAEDSTNFNTIYGLGILYYNQGVRSVLASGNFDVDFDSIPEAYYNLTRSFYYLKKAEAIDSLNKNIIYGLDGVAFALGEKKDIYVDPQAFRVVNGDTINRIDETGMLQGEWERLYPDGSFKCKGTYKDNKKDGYWECKYKNGNWQYQVNYKNGYPQAHGKWYFNNGTLKSEGNYESGRVDGLCKHYYSSGSLSSEETYSYGNIVGQCKYYNEEGVLMREGFLNVEQREGEWKFYSDEGAHVSSVLYETGVALETISVK